METKRISLVMCLLVVAAFSPQSAIGQPAEYRIAVDETAVGPVGRGFAGLTGGDTILVDMEAGRSYCCSVLSSYRELDPAYQGRFGDTRLDSKGSVSDLNSKDRSASSPPLPDANSRICFTTPSDKPTPVVSLEVLFGPDNKGAAVGVDVRCDETTLYGGFNTSVTDYNFLEISSTQNTTSDDTEAISGTITAKNVVTNTTVLDNKSFSVSPEARVDVDIHQPAGQGFGTVRICHDGPPGGISATLVQYNVTTPPLFAPVARDNFKTRRQLRGR